MRRNNVIGITFITLSVFSLTIIQYKALSQDKKKEVSRMNKMKHIVLLGASVGKAWNIEFLTKRINCSEYTFEFIDEYSPDKSGKLIELLNRKQNKPDAVIIKVCAAYFPGDITKYQNIIIKCVNLCRDNKVTPILATVVPVVKTYALRMFLINLINKKFGVPSHTFDSVIAFNNWIKQYAEKERIVVLDLEAAVRISPFDRHLKSEFAKKDGLHLNAKAYRELDKIVIPTLREVKWMN